ncbi:fumarylacetoacetate hydrolase family protein [Paraglaciecola sp.]|uniref:fumarylacetoacetate hydrolase family protein n=1 Tax=Paraglaciecola sp. TaxID=1920173 RepID=UPI0030F4A64D
MRWLVFFSIFFSALSEAENSIIPMVQGLTLAQIDEGDKVQTILVTRDSHQKIEGYNLAKVLPILGDPIEAYRQLKDMKIEDLENKLQDSPIEVFDYTQLKSPAGKGSHHIALGFNYAEHAEEIKEDKLPFLFLKTTPASREENIAFSAEQLLDYEVEICARPTETITESERNTVSYGYFLCGDFTDRAYLVSHLDHENMRSGKGFSAAKSMPGYFPTGPYLVFPRDSKAFLSSVKMALWRNNKLKQQTYASQMIWGMDDILTNLFDANSQGRPTYAVDAPQWLEQNQLTPDNSILTGTPSGVIMRPPGLWFQVKYGTWYFLSGSFMRFGGSVQSYVIEQFLDNAFEQKHYLQRGESVKLAASYLGQIDIVIK